MKKIWALVASILLVPFTANAATGAIGTVSALKGNNAQVERSSTRGSLSASSSIESMDLIVLGSNTSSEIKFVDDTNVKITANSRLLIDDFVYDPNNKSTGKLGLKVALGTVRYASGQIAKNHQQGVSIRTPTATIAVRGTDFSLTVDEVGGTTVVLLPSCDDDVQLRTFELNGNCVTGSIVVNTQTGSVTLSQPFTATYVRDVSTPPTPPVQVSSDLHAVATNDIILKMPPTIQAVLEAQVVKKETGKDEKELKAEAEDQQKVTVDSNNDKAVESAIAQQSAAEEKLITGNPDSVPRNPDVSAVAVASTTDTVNSCFPFTSCGNERGKNWYLHQDDKNNIISVTSADNLDNTNYNISVNANDLSSRTVGSGTSNVTIRQWNR